MLAKTNRFRGQGQVNYTLRKGKRQNIPDMTVLSVEQGTGLKAAVVVSKKISKNAVDRNKIRRKIYAALKDLVDQKLMVVVIVHSLSVTDKTSDEIAGDLKKVLS